jgi:DNA-binding protein HU-beta
VAEKERTAKKGMTQREVIAHFAEKFKLSHAEAQRFFDELVRLATSEIERSGEFTLPGFGKLVRTERRSREGRNPSTGETIQIPAKTVLRFRIAKSLKADLTGDRDTPQTL